MRILSVFLPLLPTDRILRARPAAAAEAPFALSSRVKGAERLVAVNRMAARRGLRAGMAVADSRALCPALALEAHDPLADAATLMAITDWCGRFTPLAALDPPQGVLLDVTGAAALFGGEAQLLDEIERRLAAQGFAALAALAPGPALARALARFSTLRLVPPQAAPRDIEAIAAPLPVAALALDDKAAARLARAGLRSIGDLASRPRAPLAARLGAPALARLDALLGRIREPITPRRAPPSYIAERRFPDGLTQLPDIEETLKRLAEELCPLLRRHGVGARDIEAVFYRVDGAVKRLFVRASRPLADPARIFALLRERLGRLAEEGLDTGYGFDVLRLGAVVVEQRRDEQTSLAPQDAASQDAAADRDEFADLIDRLGARLGRERVLRLYPQPRHLPEEAVLFAPASSSPRAASLRAQNLAPTAPMHAQDVAQAVMRPLRLLERAEPIETQESAPQAPPLRFRWRRVWRETVAFEGPERITAPWERAPLEPFVRDYFRVVDREGERLWLYRESFLHDARPPRWYVQGMF